MKAVQFSEHGAVEVLQFVSLPTPRPGAGEVLIKVAAAGVNYSDIAKREGTYPRPVALPHVTGVEVAKNRGQRVVAAVGNEAKKATALALGADAAVSYADADWVQQVRHATNGQGVAATFDAVGGQVGTAALQALGAGGTGVVYGAASGEPTQLNAQQLIGQNQLVRGYTLFAEVARMGEYMQELLAYLQAGKLQLPVQTYPIAEVRTAQRDMEARRTQGKVALLF